MREYKIRYLTPKEVGRFMGVSDENIDKLINSELPKLSLYKMFGNSIVVNCMSEMFKNMFVKSIKKTNKTLW